MKNRFRYIALYLGALLFSNRESKVLFYHDIHDKNSYLEDSTPLPLFKKHIQTIRNESYEIVTDITQKHNQIKLQFDDGFKGIYDCLSFLVVEKIPVEVFIISSEIGNANFLSENQIIELSNSGLVKISSHSHSHLELNNIDEKTLKYELLHSKRILETLCNQTIDSICYPFGYFSPSVIEECRSANYLYQYSSIAGSFHENIFDNVIRRNLVQFANIQELKLILKGANAIFNILYFKRHFSK